MYHIFLTKIIRIKSFSGVFDEEQYKTAWPQKIIDTKSLSGIIDYKIEANSVGPGPNFDTLPGELQEIILLRKRAFEEIREMQGFAVLFFGSLRWIQLYSNVIKVELRKFSKNTKEKNKRMLEDKVKVDQTYGTGWRDGKFMKNDERVILLLAQVLDSPLISSLIIRECSKNGRDNAAIDHNNGDWKVLTKANLKRRMRGRSYTKEDWEDESFNIDNFESKKNFEGGSLFDFYKTIRNKHQHHREYEGSKFQEELYSFRPGSEQLYKILCPQDNLALYLIFLQIFLCPGCDDAHAFNINNRELKYDSTYNRRTSFIYGVSFLLKTFFDIDNEKVDEELEKIHKEVIYDLSPVEKEMANYIGPM